jgi:AraC-like DNA-binding protein
MEFSQGLTEEYSGPILLGASASNISTPTIEISIQELEAENYSIRYGNGKFLKKAAAFGEIFKKGLYHYFMLKGGARKKFESLGSLHVRQDQFVSVYSDEMKCEAIFDKGVEFEIFDVYYSPSLIELLVPCFPQLALLGKSSVVGNLEFNIQSIAPQIKEVIHQILNCPYDDDTRKFYFEIKVRELLFQVLRKKFIPAANELVFSGRDKAKILRAKTLLEAYVAMRNPSIKVLATMVSINEFKLKAGFRQFFGTGVFEWLLNKRMLKAKELLQNTDMPLKELCKMVGYRRSSNFVTAFRNKFGVTPGSFRRK